MTQLHGWREQVRPILSIGGDAGVEFSFVTTTFPDGFTVPVATLQQVLTKNITCRRTPECTARAEATLL